MNVKSCFLKVHDARRAWNVVYWKVKTGVDIYSKDLVGL